MFVLSGRGLTPDPYCPAVTTGLKQVITSLNFAGNGPDDLTAGCQPFVVVHTSQHDHYRALDDAMVASQLDQGTANASLADIRDIREKEKVKLPQDVNQASPYLAPICYPSAHAVSRPRHCQSLCEMHVDAGQQIPRAPAPFLGAAPGTRGHAVGGECTQRTCSGIYR